VDDDVCVGQGGHDGRVHLFAHGVRVFQRHASVHLQVQLDHERGARAARAHVVHAFDLWVVHRDRTDTLLQFGRELAIHQDLERIAPDLQRAVPDDERDADRVLPLSHDHTGIGGIPDYQVLGDHRDVAFYRAGYYAEIRYLDDEIGRLLRGVTERDLDGRTVVAFAADHGEGLGEDDYWFAHGEYLNEAQVRVPHELKLALHRNTEIELLCPVPATFVDSSCAATAQALWTQVRRQFHGEVCTLINLPFQLATV